MIKKKHLISIGSPKSEDRSRIKGIMSPQCDWTDSEEQVHRIFSDHFKNIYTEPNPSMDIEEWEVLM